MTLDDDFFKYLKEKGFDERWLLLASMQGILLYVMSGFSNKTIAKMVSGLDETYIQAVCTMFLDFDGWEEDLDYNPWYLYKKDRLTEEGVYDIISICKKYEKYRKELEDYYDRGTIT